jgi:hypothetical protein
MGGYEGTRTCFSKKGKKSVEEKEASLRHLCLRVSLKSGCLQTENQARGVRQEG